MMEENRAAGKLVVVTWDVQEYVSFERVDSTKSIIQYRFWT
jgi:hypothetical protein